jgi:hypothetical protein
VRMGAGGGGGQQEHKCVCQVDCYLIACKQVAWSGHNQSRGYTHARYTTASHKHSHMHGSAATQSASKAAAL